MYIASINFGEPGVDLHEEKGSEGSKTAGSRGIFSPEGSWTVAFRGLVKGSSKEKWNNNCSDGVAFCATLAVLKDQRFGP